MDIHEYQAKEILSSFGVEVPNGGLAFSPEQAAFRAREIGGDMWAVKAQVHSGARGKAGGIHFCTSEVEIQKAAKDLLGKILVTEQTGPRGKAVYRLYVEQSISIRTQIYIGFVLDRTSERIMVVASASGGMEIEEISSTQPNSIIRVIIEPAIGLQEFQAREIVFDLGIEPEIIPQATTMIMGCYRAFRDLDATMVEINPLVITDENNLIALDAKMSFDDNALYRRPEILELRDKSQEDARETYASDRGLSYIGLDGEIGCIINGAGLAMATMDMIKLKGGEPANFLDIGGGASPERVIKAFKAVLADPNVKTILVNIFAGINRCDWIATGVIEAVKLLSPNIPIVVRLAGTNVEEGRSILNESRLDITVADTLANCAEIAVNLWRLED